MALEERLGLEAIVDRPTNVVNVEEIPEQDWGEGCCLIRKSGNLQRI